MEKADLVTTKFITRIIMDEREVGNDELLNELLKTQLLAKISNDEILENIDEEIVEDLECPYVQIKFHQGDMVKVKIDVFNRVYGEAVWIIDHIKTQLNEKPVIYVCYMENDKRKTLFNFIESDLELIK